MTEIFKIQTTLSFAAAQLLADDLKFISQQMTLFLQQKKGMLSSISESSIVFCQGLIDLARQNIRLSIIENDSSFQSGRALYRSKMEKSEVLNLEQRFKVIHFMYRTMMFALKNQNRIRENTPARLEVKRQFKVWHNQYYEDYLSLKEKLSGRTKRLTQTPSYNEPSLYFVKTGV